MGSSRNDLDNVTLGILQADLLVQELEGNPQADWRADGSLTLATISSLSRGYNLAALMDQFTYWYLHADYTALRKKQVPGRITEQAIQHYLDNRDPFSSGSLLATDTENGALLRITPVVLFLRSEYGPNFVSKDPAMLILHQICGVTHNTPRTLIAVGLYAMIVNELLSGEPLDVALDNAVASAFEYYAKHPVFAADLSAFDTLNTPDFKSLSVNDITASADVIDTLESTLWVLLNTSDKFSALHLASELKGSPQRMMPLLGAMTGIMYGAEPLESMHLTAKGMGFVTRILTIAKRHGVFETTE